MSFCSNDLSDVDFTHMFIKAINLYVIGNIEKSKQSAFITMLHTAVFYSIIIRAELHFGVSAVCVISYYSSPLNSSTRCEQV